MASVSLNCAAQVRRTVMVVALVVCSVSFLGCTPLQSALWDSAKSVKAAPTADSLPISTLPQMQVTVQKTTFWMSQVHFEKASPSHPSSTTGLQVWMTPAGEIIRLTPQGRLSSTSGATYADWTHSKNHYLPSQWRKVRDHLLSNKELQYLRERSVTPGDFSNIQERITIKALAKAPKIDWPHPLPFAEQLQWFEEHAQLLDSAGRWALLPTSKEADAPMGQALPPARFAVAFLPDGQEHVVYSEQCLSHAVCLRMQHWHPSSAAALFN